MSEDEIVFESPADAHGWTHFPNVVLRDGEISVPARLLYGLLMSYANLPLGCVPGQETLAGMLGGVTTRSVRNYLTELETQLLIRTERRGSTSNRYVMLALGIRAKRLADRKSASGRDDRNDISGQTGNLVPRSKTEGSKTEVGESARTGAKKIKVSGKPVNEVSWSMTAECLASFNEQAGKKLRLLTSAGEPSEAAKRIYGRVRAYPDITLAEHADIIRRTLASRWWGKGEASIGVVYGPKVFEDNITRQPTDASGPSGGGKASASDLLKKLRGDG